MPRVSRPACILALLIAATIAHAQAPTTRAFAYQCQVKKAGAPLTGTADFIFSLYDSLTGGTQIGTDQFALGTNLVNGLATAELDFGTAAFNGDGRWIQVQVRSPAGGGAYTLLSPRHPILPAPYALFALNTGPTGQSSTTAFGTASLAITPSTSSYVLIPGLTQAINVPANADVLIACDGGIQCTIAGSAGYSAVDIALQIDGAFPTHGGMRRVVAANTAGIGQQIANWSMTQAVTLTPGTHTIAAYAAYVDGATANVSSGVAPQLQGELTVTIIKK